MRYRKLQMRLRAAAMALLHPLDPRKAQLMEDQPPLRAELLSDEQMALHGSALAGIHIIGSTWRPDRLLKRLADNEQVLLSTCKLLTAGVKAKLRIAPAGEWLLDNYYLIEEQIRAARQHLPKGYSRELPRLTQGPSAGLPRVYDLALEAISHGDGRLDLETLSRFVAAYQTVTPLTLGELWAIPIMLQLALIENLRRVAVRINTARMHLSQAQDWANQMMAIAESDPKSLILVIADMARSGPPMVSPFVAELARRLQGHGPALALPLTWIEQRLAESSRTIEQMVLAETQQQAADQVSIGNTVGSLRLLGAVNWRDFVETASLVEQALRADPGGVYAAMDFASRDRYRHVLERLAKRSKRNELDLAHLVIKLAAAAGSEPDVCQGHVGYYLIDHGRPQLEQAIGLRTTLHSRLQGGDRRLTLSLYLVAILLLSGLAASIPLTQAYLHGLALRPLVLLTGLSMLIASALGVAVINWLASQLAAPLRLPRMDYTAGLPADMQTLVVVPCLLDNLAGIDELLEALEVRYIGNQDQHLRFGLLTDFRDAPSETLPADHGLLQHALDGIARLNDKYRSAGTDRFHLFHRPRRWSAAEAVWMGHERKRGKLADLNEAIRSGLWTRFIEPAGGLGALSTLRYIITLDSDTQLPRDTARQLVSVMAHPLNRPRYHADGQRMHAGYAILQPRMAACLSQAQRSRYAQLFGSEPGIDPYTRSVSDTYQDLFGEGSFIGKGIYDIAAFEHALKDRLPENRILSHDLLEGGYSRSCLLSDVHLYEEYPAAYHTDVIRQRRWIRGDWQIARWLLPTVPSLHGGVQTNPLSALTRWKVLDNLRRHLLPPASLLLLLLAWTVLPQAWLWTLAVVAVSLLPPLLIAGIELLRKPEQISMRAHAGKLFKSLQLSMAQAGFKLACLPYEAMFNLDAMLRTMWRMFVSHRRLMEWQVSSSSGTRAPQGCAASYRTMWIAPTTAVAAALLANAAALPIAAPIILLWLCAPALAWWMSLPLVAREVQLSAEQRRFLRRMARKTWAYFEQFVVAEDHWLPPDNVQEQPGTMIAHRTSPTNIGLSLLANLSACDFGYLTNGQLLQRTRDSFHTLAQLPRHLGHFYNWYDTRTLQTLAPRYISTVDSGNLAGLLLTLRMGLLDLAERPIIGAEIYHGLSDTLALCSETAQAPTDARADTASDQSSNPPAASSTLLTDLQTQLDRMLIAPSRSLTEAWRSLQIISGLANGFDTRGDLHASSWTSSFATQCDAALDELQQLAPWLQLAKAPVGLEACTADALLSLPGDDDAADSNGIPGLRKLLTLTARAATQLEARLLQDCSAEQAQWLRTLRDCLAAGHACAKSRIELAEALAHQAAGLASMEYGFLYDQARHLLAIGYNVDELRLDAGYYDLLASEARLCSFVAIAQGQIPQESWFALGRLRGRTENGEPVLLSWSGSMFEYLMPLLVMPCYRDTLLDQTCHAAVAQQIVYGQQRSLPWGVSESGYNTVDAHLNYQYHAFGVPGLGLKRGLADDAVIAPYASVLALMVAPEAACANLQLLADAGLEGRYGFYEAIDYTPARLPRADSSVVEGRERAPQTAGVIVQSFMAHHQGMSLLALSHLLHGQPMQRRFEADPELQSTLLLLQERIPRQAATHTRSAEHGSELQGGLAAVSVNAPIPLDTPAPEVQLLSNGRYHVMLSNAGGGYSLWKQLALTRWREDATRDHWGSFLYLRDIDSGEFWSATHQPTLKKAERYEAMFSEGRAEFRRLDHGIESYSEIVISPEDDIELRRLRLSNRSRASRTIELTSYAEVVLAAAAADQMHSAFGKLFVQTEIIADRRAILCTRRPRSQAEPTPWMFHLLAAHGNALGPVSFETDRVRFIGRGRDCASPMAMQATGALSGNAGSVLDPIVAIRCQVTLAPGESTTLDWVYGAADQREACVGLIEKYQDRHLADRVFDLAWTHSSVTLRQINAHEADAQLYRRLAGPVLYAHAALRAEPGVLVQNRRSQSGLWGYAISGDLPIVLLKIADGEHIDIARQMIQCHAYWRLKGLIVDLVIWNEDHIGYRQRLQDQIMGLIATGSEAHAIDRPGGIFVRSAEQISSEDRVLLQTVARVIVADGRGTLLEQINRRAVRDSKPPTLFATSAPRAEPEQASPLPADLQLSNRHGGFSRDGREYLIASNATRTTPLPWVNVIANPHFGTVISESGSAYTWSENAHEFRLTPWSDDAVGASSGEAIYLRDEDSGRYWSPMPLPCRSETPHLCRHGHGYSVFEHSLGGIQSELWIYVDLVESVKFSVLKVRNRSGRRRRLSATCHVDWVLGDLRDKSLMHVITEIDDSSGALFARNRYNSAFPDKVSFLDVDDMARTLTGDRREFVGRNGTLSQPAAMSRTHLSGKVGAALDPCGTIQVPFDLADGQDHETIFRLCSARDVAHARALVARYRKSGAARDALAQVRQYWTRTLGAIQIETPDAALDVLTNGWLVYQTLACRLWARSGYSQSGGAYGFRDQLQDAMALVHTEPRLLREQLLRCASRQYTLGDVQHWWHPPEGRGVRTRCSDDYLWLPYGVCRYLRSTLDAGILDERVHFLEGRLLAHDEESYYDLPGRSGESADLYQHCVRSIQHGLRFGEHGLPLMGSGDWNDGMNLVGIEGRGESVWLGWFLHQILLQFAPLAEARGDTAFARHCRDAAATLLDNIELHGWDGDWYRRAYFDDGSPLGSASNPECAIDSLAQSWSVLSGGAAPERASSAMNALDLHLVRRDRGLVQLLDPPFDTSSMNPGYIKGYVPGVRENGGQYTHAAVWAAMAYARMGDGRRAWELLSILNPAGHSHSDTAVARYKAEPYAIAADVYGVAPHIGRGGWTWYTGAAGWMYRLIVESLMGLQLDHGRLCFAPCLPASWPRVTIQYRHGETSYHIDIRQQTSAAASDYPGVTVTLDDIIQPGPAIPLTDDAGHHVVHVLVMRRSDTTAIAASPTAAEV